MKNSRVAFIRLQVGANHTEHACPAFAAWDRNIYAIALRVLNRTQLSIQGDIRICQALRSRQQSLFHLGLHLGIFKIDTGWRTHGIGKVKIFGVQTINISCVAPKFAPNMATLGTHMHCAIPVLQRSTNIL